MMLPRNFHCFFCALAVIITMGLLPYSLLAEENPEEKKVKPPVTDEQKTTIIQIYSWATILPRELIDLKDHLSKDKDIRMVEEELGGLTEETNVLRKDAMTARTTEDLQNMQVTNYQNKVYKITARLKKISDLITATISDLSAKRTEWQSKKEQIQGYDKIELLSLTLAEDEQKQLVDTVGIALQLIEKQLKRALIVGKAIGDLQVLLYAAEADLKAKDAELKAISIQQTSPSMLSSEFYSRINANLFLQSFSNTWQFITDQLESLQKKREVILLILFAFLLVFLGVHKTKSLITSSSDWYPFAAYPLATTVFITSSINAFIDFMPFRFDLPQQWEALLHIFTLLAAMRLTTHLIEDKLRRRFLVRMILLIAVAMIMVLLDLPQMLMLLYVFYVSLLALVYYFYRLPSTKGKTDLWAWIKRIMGIFPAAVLFLGISGYDQFAVIIFSTILSSVIACLVVWILYLLHFGFLDLLLLLLPFSLFRDNREKILHSLKPIIVWLHIIFLIAVQGFVWDLYPTVNDAFAGIYNLGFDLFTIHVSPGFFLTVIFVVYAAFLVSRAIQSLLLNKVLPRYGAERGVQLSITRLVHYAILTIGFLIMLRVLGFQLNQLALLGGALGVGIGFGLQAIVSNFVSGLILLFERPIKVGDTIQVGADIGEVKNLGLRATIIQTFDNAEIVVPNSDLITGQVTNWTLGERRVRVRIPVGVAYGTDVAKVLKVLIDCASANPVVLSTPEPNAFFLAVGASSLGFEVRVWISEYLDKVQVLSDLNQDIENEFALNNIEIPFPQTDLHLRSVDEAAAVRMWGPTEAADMGKK